MAVDVPAGGIPIAECGDGWSQGSLQAEACAELEGPSGKSYGQGGSRGTGFLCIGGRGGCLGLGEAGVPGSR